jgi:DHA1 family multidrug resistance protein-like MFS transporter
MEQNKSDLRSSWVWLLLIFTAASLIDAAFYGQIMAFTPLHLKSLGLSAEEVVTYTGLLTSLTWAVGIPFLPLWGALADRYSRQPVIVRSFLAFLVAGVLMLVARNIWVFGLGRAIMSFALGNSGLMMTTLAERVPKHRVGLAFAIMNSAAPIGYFAAPLLGGPVVDAWGLPALLWINMALIALVTLALAFGYRDTYRGTATGSLLGMAAESVVIIGRSPAVRSLFVALFALFLGWQIVLPYIPLVVTDIYRGVDPATAVGIVVASGGLATVIIGPLTGALADRYGRWRLLFIGSFLSVVLLPLPLLASSVGGLSVTWGLANGVFSALFALSFTVLSESTPEATRGRVMSFAYLPANVSATAGSALGSVVAADNVRRVFPVASILTLLGIGVLAWAAKKREPSAESPDASIEVGEWSATDPA